MRLHPALPTLSALIIAAIGLNACKSEPAAPPAPSEPRFTLMAPGAEPRRALRFQPDKGHTETASMTMALTMNLELGGQPLPMTLPVMATDLAIEVEDTTPAGDFTYAMRVTDARVEEGGGADPAIARAIASSLKDMAKLKGRLTTNSRGEVLDASVKMPVDVNPQLKQVFESFEQSLDQLAIPLPEEPIGVGARWEVVKDVEQNGMVLRMTSTFELTAIEGDVVSISHSLVQSAVRQRFTPAGMPPGASATLESLSGSGRGQGRIDLRGVLPAEFSSEVDVSLSMEVEAEGQKQAISVTTGLVLSVTRSAPDK